MILIVFFTPPPPPFNYSRLPDLLHQTLVPVAPSWRVDKKWGDDYYLFFIYFIYFLFIHHASLPTPYSPGLLPGRFVLFPPALCLSRWQLGFWQMAPVFIKHPPPTKKIKKKKKIMCCLSVRCMQSLSYSLTPH